VPVHAWQTYRALKKYLRRDENHDVIFVPTVMVHHLLGWTWLIKRVLKPASGRVLLFFPNTPIQLDPVTNAPSWQAAPTARLFCRLIRSLASHVAQGRVILGVETRPMQTALTQLTGVPFTYFPHPVTPVFETLPEKSEVGNLRSEIVLGSYGSARDEKGSAVLVAAVEEYCRRHSGSRVRFVLQSVDGDATLWARLQGNPRVRLIPDYFGAGGYVRQLQSTDVLLLPYRLSSYGLRVSRVVIEALVNGLPVVVTQGTTLADQSLEFGSAVFCQDGDTATLVSAIEKVADDYESLAAKSLHRLTLAREHFSVRQFRAGLQSGHNILKI